MLQLSVYPSGPSFKLPVKMEVLIGSMPLTQFISPSTISSKRQKSDKSRTNGGQWSPVTQSSVHMTDQSIKGKHIYNTRCENQIWTKKPSI